MTWYRDLSPYRYTQEPCADRTLNVGWLSREREHTRGQIDPRHVELIWDRCRVIALDTRGLHPCELCPEEARSNWFVHSGERRRLGSGQIRVFAANGDIFAAPDLLFHYVRDHAYRPPDVFLTALEESLAFDLEVYTAGLRYRGIPWRYNPSTPEDS